MYQWSPCISQTLFHSTAVPNSLPLPLSAAQQDDDVNKKQADEDEGEVDEQLLQVPLDLWVHLDLRRSADGRLGHVLNSLHGDGRLVIFWWTGWIERKVYSQAAGPVWTDWVRLASGGESGNQNLLFVVCRWAQVRCFKQPGLNWAWFSPGYTTDSSLLLSLGDKEGKTKVVKKRFLEIRFNVWFSLT